MKARKVTVILLAKLVEREISRRRRAGLLRSLESPHPDAALVAAAGLADWGVGMPAEDEGLIDLSAGTRVRWVEGTGWVKDSASFHSASRRFRPTLPP